MFRPSRDGRDCSVRIAVNRSIGHPVSRWSSATGIPVLAWLVTTRDKLSL